MSFILLSCGAYWPRKEIAITKRQALTHKAVKKSRGTDLVASLLRCILEPPPEDPRVVRLPRALVYVVDRLEDRVQGRGGLRQRLRVLFRIVEVEAAEVFSENY